MKAVGFRYTLAWSKLKYVAATRLFITNIYNAVEETQIRHTDLMVTTESG